MRWVRRDVENCLLGQTSFHFIRKVEESVIPTTTETGSMSPERAGFQDAAWFPLNGGPQCMRIP